VRGQPDILAHAFSPLTDAWYGPFYDFDEEMTPIRQNDQLQKMFTRKRPCNSNL